MYNLDNYEPVEDRLAKFWADHKDDGRIVTRLLEVARNAEGKPVQYIVESEIWVGERCLATGLAEEVVGASPVNRTSALENAETSSLGRSLANAGYAKKGARPSREEMAKVTRHKGIDEADPFYNPRGTAAGPPPADRKASAKQLTYIVDLCKKAGFTDKAAMLGYVNTCLVAAQLEGVANATDLTFAQASAVIEQMKNSVTVEQFVQENG